jgi:hypothetical protein
MYQKPMSESAPPDWMRAFKPVAKPSGGLFAAKHPIGRRHQKSSTAQSENLSNILTKPGNAFHVGLRIKPRQGIHHERLDLRLRRVRPARDSHLSDPDWLVELRSHGLHIFLESREVVPRSIPTTKSIHLPEKKHKTTHQ